jgi:hypothetical protein
MANMADAVWAKAAVFAALWLSTVVLTMFIFGRSAAVAAGRWWSTSVGRLPAMGQQLLDPAVQLRGQPGEHVLQVGHGSCPLSLADCSRLITTAARSPAN